MNELKKLLETFKDNKEFLESEEGSKFIKATTENLSNLKENLENAKKNLTVDKKP